MDENMRLCDHPPKLWMTFLLRNGHSKPSSKGAACPQGKGCPRCSCYVYHADQVQNRNDHEISLALSLKRIRPLITKLANHSLTRGQQPTQDYGDRQVFSGKGQVWHKECFSCNRCHRHLDSRSLFLFTAIITKALFTICRTICHFIHVSHFSFLLGNTYRIKIFRIRKCSEMILQQQKNQLGRAQESIYLSKQCELNMNRKFDFRIACDAPDKEVYCNGMFECQRRKFKLKIVFPPA